ncbi:MAG TPA: hypothetical protein VNO22_06705 [Planctomycetota bacterium]|nr:hypothetical protein [Planctomycetota bacterium]
MSMSWREFWTVFHGMVVGAIYLLAFAGGLAGLWNLKRWLVTEAGLAERMRHLKIGMWVMAIVCWATVISGTYIVYPWYRANAPTSPRSMLLAHPQKAAWHTFAMEWKEHVAWASPILATAAAALVMMYGIELANRHELRRATMTFFILAFGSAAVAGVFGAFINKVAPIL